MANLSNWQDSLDERLVNRLTRPIRQPGMMKMAMGEKIINRCDRFLNRLPLLSQQMQRWGNTNTLSSESMPIVYAQPIGFNQEPQIDNKIDNLLPITQVQPVANVIQRKLDSSPSLPNQAINNTVPIQNITNLSSSDKSVLNQEVNLIPNPFSSKEGKQELKLLSLQERGLDAQSEIPVVSPQSIIPEAPISLSSESANLTANPFSSREREQELKPLSLQERRLDAQSEIPVVSPQSINKRSPQQSAISSLKEFTSLADGKPPIIQAKLQNYAQVPPSLPVVNEVNNLAHQQKLYIDNHTDNSSTIKPEISSKMLPIVTAQPLKPGVNLTKQEIKINSQTQPTNLLNTQPVNSSNSQIESALPIVSVKSANNASLKPQSLPLPIAKPANSSHPHSPTKTNSSSPPKTFSPAVSPTETVVSPIATPSQIDVDAIASQVERKLMRRLVIESERRGKNR